MMKRLVVLFAVLASAATSRGELNLKILSVTDTSQTFPLPVPSDALGLCNVGANEAYFRAFWEGETPAAATTSWNVLPAGTAAAPYCISVNKAPTQPAPWKAVSIICAGAETATVHVQWF